MIMVGTNNKKLSCLYAKITLSKKMSKKSYFIKLLSRRTINHETFQDTKSILSKFVHTLEAPRFYLHFFLSLLG